MDFFDFTPKTDEEIAQSSTKGDDIDSDILDTKYDVKDSLDEGDSDKNADAGIVDNKTKQEPDSKPDLVPEVTDLGNMFEDIADDLEANDMLFLAEDATYEPTIDGFKSLIKDNLAAMKARLERENNEFLSAKLAEIEGTSQIKFADMSTEDEDAAELMLTKWYEATGLDEDEISDKLAELNDLGLLSREARLAQKFLIRQEREQEAFLKEQRVKAEQLQIEENEKYVASLKQAILSTDEVLGIKPTEKQKKEFTEYLFKVGKDGKTQAMRDSEDDSKRLKLAWMQFLDVNAKTLETTARTKVANDIEKKHKRFTSVESTTKGVTRREPLEGARLGGGVLDFWATSRNDD